MSSRGAIKATRLEPETGRLQYFVERPNGPSDWHYADDAKFKSEFSDLVKKFIAAPTERGVRKRPLPSIAPKPTVISASSLAKRVTQPAVKKQKSGSRSSSRSSEAGSIGRQQVPIRIPVKRFREARAQAPAKLAKAKREPQSEASSEAGNVYNVNAFRLLVATPAGKSSNNQRPPSPSESSKAAKQNSSHSNYGKPNSKTKETLGKISMAEAMKKKIQAARNQQLFRERHRQLLNGISQSTASKLKPVSINIPPHPIHDNASSRSPARRSPPSPLSRSPQRVESSRINLDNAYRNSPKLSLRSPHPAVHSFLTQQQADNYSSDSGEDSSSSDQHYSSVRPKRQAASGPLAQSRYSQIVLRHRPGWTQLWLFATTRMQNALNPTVCEEMCAALKACIADSDTSLILLSSSGPTFCSGIDLNYLLDAKDVSVAAHKLSLAVSELCLTILSCPKPIFVAVNGPCAGLGVALCCLADVVIATEKATFSTPYAQLGHVPDGGLSVTLQNSIGRAMASDMLLTGRRLTAIEALRAGLVSRVLWPTNFVQELIVRLDVVASTCSPALEATKYLMRSAGTDDDVSSGLQGNSFDKLASSATILRAVQAESELVEMFWTAPESRTAMRRYMETL